MSVSRTVTRIAAGFLAVILVAEVAIRVFGALLPEPRNWYHDIAQAKAEQLREMTDLDLDIVFTGTSQTYYAIGPRLIDESLGTKSYNAAVPAGVPPIQERWLLNQVLDQVDTDVVVWGLSVVDLNDGRDLSVVDAYSSAHATRPGAIAEVERQASRLSGLVRYRRQLVDPNAWAERTKMDAIRSVIRDDGQRRPAEREPTEKERRRVRQQVVGDYDVGGTMVASIRRTMAALQARGIEIVLVWLPVPERFVDLLPHPGMQAAARDKAQQLATDFDAGFVDVSAGFGNADFLDYTHLDEPAAERLSLRLSRELAASPGVAGTLATTLRTRDELTG